MSTIQNQQALEYLESIQQQSLIERFGKDYLNKHNKVFKQSNKSDFLKEFIKSQLTITGDEKKELSKQFNDLFQSGFLLTKYEVPQTYYLLGSLFQKIELAAGRLDYKIIKRPFLGTAFSREFNAFATRVPYTEESLIVFEGELFTLSNLLAKIIASCLPDFRIENESIFFSYKIDRIEAHINQNPIIQERFTDFVLNAILKGQPNKTKQYLLDDTVLRLHYELLTSLELFIVGHEYGHIYAGHIDEASLTSKVINSKPVSIISPNWQMEYEADFYGLNLLTNTDEGRGFLPFSLLGPELFFTFLDIYERANSLYYQGAEIVSKGSEEHPPTSERRNHIRELLNKALPKKDLECYQVAGEFLENVLEVLWTNFKQKLSQQV